MKVFSLKKVAFATTLCVSATLPAVAQTTRWLPGIVPHFNEFNTSENPNHYGWCGHAALKVAEQYKSGQVKTLSEIDTIFRRNSPGGYAQQENDHYNTSYCRPSSLRWCASLQDLAWAQYFKNGGYGRVSDNIATSNMQALNVRKYVGDPMGFFNKVKEAIDLGFPVIAPSRIVYNDDGHFWVIVGYTDWWGDPNQSAFYARDVAVPYPYQSNADQNLNPQTFYNLSPTKEMLIIK
jgi:hypothetical protein